MIKILLILPLLLIFFCSTCYTYKYFCPADYTQSVLYKFNFIEYVLKILKKHLGIHLNRYLFMIKNSTLDYLNTISLFKKVFFFFLVLLLSQSVFSQYS